MCLRKLQNYNLSVIFSEFSRFTRAGKYCVYYSIQYIYDFALGSLSSSESEFVETFKAEVEIGPNIPIWLWQGVRCTKHPTLKLKLLNPPEPQPLAQHPPATQVRTQHTAHTHHARDSKKQREWGIRREFETGAFAQQQEEFSRDLQALALEGISSRPHKKAS